jgi:hypothetical protein
MCKAISLSTLLVFALVVTIFTVSAQTPTGIISGTVTDESGAVIANAAITIANKTTGATRSVTANASGIFSCGWRIHKSRGDGSVVQPSTVTSPPVGAEVYS